MSWINKLKSALSKSSNKITSKFDKIFNKKYLDQEQIDSLEELLIEADIGANSSYEIANLLKKAKFNKDCNVDEIKNELSNIITHLLNKQDHSFDITSDKLNVILCCGVNGNGKTSSIGKLANKYIQEGKKVAIASCDTFRAAAHDQLSFLANQVGATIFSGAQEADPASVAYKATEESLKNNFDILLIDTAGRLQNHTNLMQELGKIIKVINKFQEHITLKKILVIDALTGQNAISQTQIFKEITNLSGVIITKLDGSAKAGIIINIVKQFNLPIYFVTIGEKIEDIEEFNVNNFTSSLLDIAPI